MKKIYDTPKAKTLIVQTEGMMSASLKIGSGAGYQFGSPRKGGWRATDWSAPAEEVE